MPKPKFHVLICKNTRPPGHPKGSCGERGAMGIVNQFNFAVMERNLIGQVMVTPTNCLGACQKGPTVLVHRDRVWDNGVTEPNVPIIIDEHPGDTRPIVRRTLSDQLSG